MDLAKILRSSQINIQKIKPRIPQKTVRMLMARQQLSWAQVWPPS